MDPALVALSRRATGVLRGSPRRDAGPPQRAAALDGLRGLAALVVVVFHLLIASTPVLTNAFIPRYPHHLAPPVIRELLYTPLHIFWAGEEAVLVFFVLSGYVLALGAARGRAFSGRSYYPSRLVRLFVPVWGSLAVAAVLHAVLARSPVLGATPWLNAHAKPMTGETFLRDATLVGRGHGGFDVNPVLWSLQWEVIFSVVLPLFLIVAAAGRWKLLTLLASLALMAASNSDQTLYLPVFMLGCLLAFEQGRVTALRRRLARPGWRARATSAALGVSSVLGLTWIWWAGGGGGIADGTGVLGRVAPLAAALGATLAVVLALTSPGFGRLLESRPLRWLGSRSFSLYLVHDPIVVTTAFAFGARPALVPFVAVAAPLAFVGAELFFRAVERPSHRLARRLARRPKTRAAGRPVERPAIAA